MKNTGKLYEKLAQQVFDHINNGSGEHYEKINVQLDVTLKGKDTSHRIDVYWKFKIGRITHYHRLPKWRKRDCEN